ncbi:MAG: subunit of meta cleavage enzyme [Rugosibacter sp.]|nr:subunit of meta cleavage enzyme [Rugosibacter sp.]
MARYEVHQLIQNLAKVPGLLDRLTSESQVVFDEYGLTEQERQALSEASPPALASIQVHPILQMLYLIARNPNMAAQVSVRDYPAIIHKEA